MGELTTPAGIESSAADQLRIASFDSLDSIQNHFDVAKVHFPVAIQVRHAAVAHIVDINVGGVAKLVTAVPRATLAADRLIARGGSETRANPHAFRVHAVVGEVLDHELELVEQGLPENEILGPDVLLVV